MAPNASTDLIELGIQCLSATAAEDENVGTIVTIIVLFILVGVTIGYVHYRKKHNLPLKPWLNNASNYKRHRMRPDTDFYSNQMYDVTPSEVSPSRPPMPTRSVPTGPPARP